MPHTSFCWARYVAIGAATMPLTPVTRIFSSASMLFLSSSQLIGEALRVVGEPGAHLVRIDSERRRVWRMDTPRLLLAPASHVVVERRRRGPTEPVVDAANDSRRVAQLLAMGDVEEAALTDARAERHCPARPLRPVGGDDRAELGRLGVLDERIPDHGEEGRHGGEHRERIP